jgi:alpha-galactosidase
MFTPPGVAANPQQLEQVAHVVQLYKEFVRPFMSTSRLYHHTPVLPGPDPTGLGILEMASRDRSRAVAAAFVLSDPSPADREAHIRFRGLDHGRRYRVTADNHREVVDATGLDLATHGLPIGLTGPLTSELWIVEALDNGNPNQNC